MSFYPQSNAAYGVPQQEPVIPGTPMMPTTGGHALYNQTTPSYYPQQSGYANSGYYGGMPNTIGTQQMVTIPRSHRHGHRHGHHSSHNHHRHGHSSRDRHHRHHDGGHHRHSDHHQHRHRDHHDGHHHHHDHRVVYPQEAGYYSSSYGGYPAPTVGQRVLKLFGMGGSGPYTANPGYNGGHSGGYGTNHDAGGNNHSWGFLGRSKRPRYEDAYGREVDRDGRPVYRV